MNILICSDSFKDSLTSVEVSYIISDIIQKKFPKAQICSDTLADGGEGSLTALKSLSGSEAITHTSVDALLRPLKASFLIFPETQHAVIELAQTCGLSLLDPTERNCYKTSSYGVGLQILKAMEYDIKTVDLLIGGSATNDLGIGMAAALSYKFFSGNQLISQPLGRDMVRVTQIDSSIAELASLDFNVVTDVNNTLLGLDGAAFTYANQKGADQVQIEKLEDGAKNIVEIVKEKYGSSYHLEKGSGAAGGVGYGAMTFLGARKVSGIDYIIDKLEIADKMSRTDLIITGEGRLDHQTLHGKVISGISKLAKTQGKKVIAVCALNELNESESTQLGLSKVYSLYDTPPISISKRDTESRLQSITEQLIIDHLG